MRKSAYTLWLEEVRDRQKLRLVCGVDDCGEVFEGRYDEVMPARDEHREDEHPGWTPPRRVRRRVTASRR